MTSAIIGMMAVMSVALVACGGSSKDKGSAKETKSFNVELHDDATSMAVVSDPITVSPGTNVSLNVKNAGTVVHNLADENATTPDLAVQEEAVLSLGELSEDTVVFCTIAGHREQGMEFEIKVK